MGKIPRMRPTDRKSIEMEWYHSDLPCSDSMERFEKEFFIEDDMWKEITQDVDWGYDDSWDGREWFIRNKIGKHQYWAGKSADRYHIRKIDMMSFYSPSELVRRKILDYFKSKR